MTKRERMAWQKLIDKINSAPKKITYEKDGSINVSCVIDMPINPKDWRCCVGSNVEKK